MHRLRTEDLSAEADAWEYDADGNIRIAGTNLTAGGRHAGRDTKVLVDQIRTIDVSYVVGELVDYLSRDDMAQVEHSLSPYLGLLR
jgi:hypothetical protein